MTVVVDASAIVEMLARSPAGAEVERTILEGPAFAPELLDVEVISALAGLERGGALRERDARAAVKVLLDAPIVRVPHSGLIVGAWNRRANLSAYDATYVELSARLRCPLVTGDRRLARVERLGITVTVIGP